jgi:hypothetical protein
MAGAGTKGENSTSYFNLAIAELKSSSSAIPEVADKGVIETRATEPVSGKTRNYQKSNWALMNLVIWPIIGLLLAGTIIITLGWIYIIIKTQGGNLLSFMPNRQVLSTHTDAYSTFTPSCPTESEIRDLPIYSNSELTRFLDLPNEIRTANESVNIVIQMERMLTMESEHVLQSHSQ